MPNPALLRRWFALLLLVLLAAPAAAQSYPKQTGWVTDDAHLLSAADNQALTAQLYQLHQQTGRQLEVVTVNSLGGQDIDTYAPLLFRQWELGGKEAQDAVLLLVAPNERRVRITTGYGAGGFLTDLVSGQIIRDQITPRFKANDYPGGIKAGVTAIAQFMQLPPEEQQRRASDVAQAQQQQASPSIGGLAPLAIWGMIILFVLLSFTRRLGGRRYRGSSGGGISPWVVLWGLDALTRGSRGGGGWGGGGWGDGGGGFGGGGGGFGGFGGGGGSTGGGGASGSW